MGTADIHALPRKKVMLRWLKFSHFSILYSFWKKRISLTLTLNLTMITQEISSVVITIIIIFLTLHSTWFFFQI